MELICFIPSDDNVELNKLVLINNSDKEKEIISKDIEGEKEIGNYDGVEANLKAREVSLNNWLLELGW